MSHTSINFPFLLYKNECLIPKTTWDKLEFPPSPRLLDFNNKCLYISINFAFRLRLLCVRRLLDAWMFFRKEYLSALLKAVIFYWLFFSCKLWIKEYLLFLSIFPILLLMGEWTFISNSPNFKVSNFQIGGGWECYWSISICTTLFTSSITPRFNQLINPNFKVLFILSAKSKSSWFFGCFNFSCVYVDIVWFSITFTNSKIFLIGAQSE